MIQYDNKLMQIQLRIDLSKCYMHQSKPDVFKIAVKIWLCVRKVRLSFASVHPERNVSCQTLENFKDRLSAGSVSPNNLCAVERHFSLVGANQTQQLSLQLVTAKADDGGNDMV